MPIALAFARDDVARHLAGSGPVGGMGLDPLAGEPPADPQSLLDVQTEMAPEVKPPPAGAGDDAAAIDTAAARDRGVDTSTILDRCYRALAEAGGGHWKTDPWGDTPLENHHVVVDTDLDGGIIVRMITDHDIYGPGANHA